jgi:hypothetical protein
MTLTMAMVTIARPAYSLVVAATKLEYEYHLHLGYAGPRPAM